MIKTIVSIFVTLGIIFGLSFYEMRYVGKSFREFEEVLRGLYDKSVAETANKVDGVVVQQFWEEKKHGLHIWIPHSAIIEVNYQLDEAVGFLSTNDYPSAISKLEVLLSICEDVPRSYTFGVENIL